MSTGREEPRSRARNAENDLQNADKCEGRNIIPNKTNLSQEAVVVRYWNGNWNGTRTGSRKGIGSRNRGFWKQPFAASGFLVRLGFAESNWTVALGLNGMVDSRGVNLRMLWLKTPQAFFCIFCCSMGLCCRCFAVSDVDVDIDIDIDLDFGFDFDIDFDIDFDTDVDTDVDIDVDIVVDVDTDVGVDV